MKLAIVGLKTLLLSPQAIRKYIPDTLFYSIDTIISNGSNSIAICAEKFAQHYKFKFINIFPDFFQYKKEANFIRNTDIVEKADLMLAFYDNESIDTIDIVSKAKKEGKFLGFAIVEDRILWVLKKEVVKKEELKTYFLSYYGNNGKVHKSILKDGKMIKVKDIYSISLNPEKIRLDLIGKGWKDIND